MAGSWAGWALAVVLAFGQAVTVAEAEDRVSLGWGRIFTNDGLGDFKDRWRTGSYTLSHLRGTGWHGARPARFGDLLEFRARAEIIAPARLDVLPPGDRRYAGLASLGLHSHFETRGIETSLGLDLVATGPQTGLDDLQALIHRLLDYPEPDVAQGQIPDALHPTLVLELGRSLELADGATVRPFVEGQAGLETFLRAGVDLSFGRYGSGALMLRDPVTGQPYRAIPGDVSPGLTVTLGGDLARVFDSALLPAGGPQAEPERARLRAGLAWQGKTASAFYGLTWLSEEFDTQAEPQLVGALSLSLRF